MQVQPSAGVGHRDSLDERIAQTSLLSQEVLVVHMTQARHERPWPRRLAVSAPQLWRWWRARRGLAGVSDPVSLSGSRHEHASNHHTRWREPRAGVQRRQWRDRPRDSSTSAPAPPLRMNIRAASWLRWH